MGRKKSAESLPAKCDLDSESDMAHGIVQLCHVFFQMMMTDDDVSYVEQIWG